MTTETELDDNSICKIKIKMDKNKDSKKIREILILNTDIKRFLQLEIVLPKNISIEDGEAYLRHNFLDLYRPSRKINIKLSTTSF